MLASVDVRKIFDILAEMEMNSDVSHAANLDDISVQSVDQVEQQNEVEMMASDDGDSRQITDSDDGESCSMLVDDKKLRDEGDMEDITGEMRETDEIDEAIKEEKEIITEDIADEKFLGEKDTEVEAVHPEEHGRRSSRTPKPRVVYFAELPPVSHTHTGHVNNSHGGHHASNRNNNGSSNNNSNSSNSHDDTQCNEDGEDDFEISDNQSGLGSALPALKKFFTTRLEQVVVFLGGIILFLSEYQIFFLGAVLFVLIIFFFDLMRMQYEKSSLNFFIFILCS